MPAIGPARSRQPQIGPAADCWGGGERGTTATVRQRRGDKSPSKNSGGKPQSPTASARTHTSSSSLVFIRRRAFCRVKAGEPVTHAAPFTLLAFSEANDGGELVQIGPAVRRVVFTKNSAHPRRVMGLSPTNRSCHCSTPTRPHAKAARQRQRRSAQVYGFTIWMPRIALPFYRHEPRVVLLP